MEKHPPLQATRNHCLIQCCKNLPAEVRVCDAEGQCPIWSLRFGRKPDGFTGNVLKTIKAQCRMCRCSDELGGMKVKDCPNKGCNLWSFRLGKNPSRKGIGGGNAETLKKWRAEKAAESLTEREPDEDVPNDIQESVLARELRKTDKKTALNPRCEVNQSGEATSCSCETPCAVCSCSEGWQK